MRKDTEPLDPEHRAWLIAAGMAAVVALGGGTLFYYDHQNSLDSDRQEYLGERQLCAGAEDPASCIIRVELAQQCDDSGYDDAEKLECVSTVANAFNPDEEEPG